MDKQALLTYLKQRRDSLQNLVDRDFGGQASFNYMGALRELKYLIVYIEELNRFDREKPLSKKENGTLLAAMHMALADRDRLKRTAKKNDIEHLNDLEGELKLTINLERMIKETK
jgi:hypothetical protein